MFSYSIMKYRDKDITSVSDCLAESVIDLNSALRKVYLKNQPVNLFLKPQKRGRKRDTKTDKNADAKDQINMFKVSHVQIAHSTTNE